MPYGDGTGPLGLGPRTGRGLGYCSGYNSPGYVNCCRGYRGYWRWLRFGIRNIGRGLGFGWNRYRVIGNEVGNETESQILQQEKKQIQQEIEELKKEEELIDKRLKDLNKQ